jgi:hypothetical protein
MKIKFNWGWNITLLYSSFVCFILFMGYLASREKVELVSANYYDEELKYQNRIDKIALTDSMHVKPEWQVNGNQIAMLFPKSLDAESIRGNIHFYCPADEKRDFSVPFQAVANKRLSISSDKLHHGTYRMQIDWTEGKKDFYTEGVITVQ